jgi:ATP-binding cassette subfamily B protein/subfamily B ATP-binding cassette protein MsbA
MRNFLRAVRLTLRRKWTFAAMLATAIAVGALWGGNLSLVQPITAIIFAGKPPHDAIRDQVAGIETRIAQLESVMGELKQQIARAHGQGRPAGDLRRELAAADVRLDAERKALAFARRLEGVVVRWLPNHSFHALALLIGLLLAATLAKVALLVSNMILVERLAQRATYELRKQLFRRTLKLEVSTLGDDRSSNLLARFTHDMNLVHGGLEKLLGRVMLEPLKLIACLIGAAWISWRLLLVSLLIAPLVVLVIGRLMQSLKRANRRAMEEMTLLYHVISEVFVGIHAIKAFGMERHARRKLHRGGKQYYFKAMRIALYNALARCSAEALGTSVLCMALLVGAYLVLNQQTDLFGIRIMDRPLGLPSLVAFYTLLAGMLDPARKLSEVFNYLQRGMAAADRIYEILDRKPRIVDPPEPKFVKDPCPELVFDKVSFAYNPGQLVLRDVELTIPFGETVAIVGPNGCGKTTLINLLPRFYDPIEGAIRLDGLDLRELRLRDLRQMIGMVSQQGLLFDDTILSNIRFGTPHATEAEVIEAAKKAHAHKFITEKLEKGYHTSVGERGGRLSGGQRQRILLARAILRDPKILILDEATSQIDLESEQLIHRVLEQFTRGRTTLMITHRVSSLALASRIVVLDGGRVIDVGPHEELVRRCDLYRRLYQIGFRQTA